MLGSCSDEGDDSCNTPVFRRQPPKCQIPSQRDDQPISVDKRFYDALSRAERSTNQYFRVAPLKWSVLRTSDPEKEESIKDGAAATIDAFYVRCRFDGVMPAAVFDAVWRRVSVWNRRVSSFRVLRELDVDSDIVWITTAAIHGGLTGGAQYFIDARRRVHDKSTNAYHGVYTDAADERERFHGLPFYFICAIF